MTRAIGLLCSFDVLFEKKNKKNPVVRYIFLKEYIQVGWGGSRVVLVWGCWGLRVVGGESLLLCEAQRAPSQRVAQIEVSSTISDAVWYQLPLQKGIWYL